MDLVDKMCKYEMDRASVVEDTKQTLFCPQMDGEMNRQVDRWTDGQDKTSIPPLQFIWGVIGPLPSM